MTKDEKTHKKQILLENLNKQFGNISNACMLAGISRQTYYRWIEEDEELKNKAEEVIETNIDFVETRLMEKIRAGNTTAIIFFLKTRGKKRGYTEKEFVSPNDTGTLYVQWLDRLHKKTEDDE